MYLPHAEQEDGHAVDLHSRHGLTDCHCCLAFLLALGGLGFLHSWAMNHGSIGKLYHSVDHKGQVCGVSANVTNAPYLYWCPRALAPGGMSLNLERPICVAHCPGDSQPMPGLPMAVSAVRAVEPGCAEVSGPQGMASYKTTLWRHRYCMPDAKEYPALARAVSEQRLTGRSANVLESLSAVPTAWPVLVLTFLVSIGLGYLYLALMRSCAEPLLRLSMLLLVLGLLLLGYRLWVAGEAAAARAGLEPHSPSVALLPRRIGKNAALLARCLAASCWALASAFTCIACGHLRRVAAASACLEVACEAVFEMRFSLMPMPALRALCEALLVPVLLYGLLLLCSCTDVASSRDVLTHVFGPGHVQVFAISMYVFLSLWLLSFLTSLYQFMVAYAIAEYYYTPYDHDDEKDVGCCAVWDGLGVGLTYHSGSFAYGALVIGLIRGIRWMAECAEYRDKDGRGNPVVGCVFCCCSCVARCCGDEVAFLNHNAYIDMVITSHSFCNAARQAQQMVASLGGSAAALNGATSLLATFGTAMIVLATGYVVSGGGALADRGSALHVDDPVIVTAVLMLVAFRVALCFMGVFDVASDTLLYCYGIDLQSGTGGHTAPAALKQLIHSGEQG